MNGHIPVLRDQALTALAIKPDGIYLDGTFGRGGHASLLLASLGPTGRLLVMDKDPEAIREAQAKMGHDTRVAIGHDSFANLAGWNETANGLDGVLFDLGVSSPQLDQADRGFSFMQDGPLDMRMDSSRGQSVADYLARVKENDLADVLYRYGEERDSRRLARAILLAREQTPITRTSQLAEIIAKATRSREPGKHPATRSFQALRIHINDELGDLERGLTAALDRLRLGGRLVVISFHSLEDRIAKLFMRRQSTPAPTKRGLPPPSNAPRLRLRLIGEPIRPNATEIIDNPRSRSAVLRVAECIA